MRRKSKPIVFLEILVLLFIAALTFTGFGLADECEEPPADGDGTIPPIPPDGGSGSLLIQPFDAVCLGDTREIQIEGWPAGANVTQKLINNSGDARFYGANGSTTLDFSGLPFTATIYGQATSTALDGITLTAIMTYGGTAQAAEAFSVLELKSLEVTNATLQPDGCYLATTGSGDVVISAVTQPTLNESTLVEDVLTWSGGQPDGRLRRRVSRATAGATTVTAGCEPVSKSVNICVVGVNILSADITSDQIEISLSPTTASGQLVVTLVGAGPNLPIFDGTVSGGTYTYSFNPRHLAVGQYTQVQADWTVGGSTFTGTRDVSFNVLGAYLHSQYNTPSEASCSGGPENAYITNAACNFTPTMLRSGFISQVNLNGSGRSINFGDVVREEYCVNQFPNHPPDSPERSFRQQAIVPACSGFPLSDYTVAREPGHPYLVCGDQVLIVGLGENPGTVKTVTDLCPKCSTNQLDNYTTDPACSGITHLGNFVTIRLR